MTFKKNPQIKLDSMLTSFTVIHHRLNILDSLPTASDIVSHKFQLLFLVFNELILHRGNMLLDRGLMKLPPSQSMNSVKSIFIM